MYTTPAPNAPRVALVGCAAQKAKHRTKARVLYTSALFRTSLEYAEKTCDEVLIVSALYGIIPPDQVIEPYNRKLDEFGLRDREDWGCREMTTFARREVKPVVVILAGKLYADALMYGAHWHNLPRPETPLDKIAGVGKRIAWLRERTPT